MKTKTSKQPKQSKPTVQLKDMKPRKNPKAGDTPALRKGNWILDQTYRAN